MLDWESIFTRRILLSWYELFIVVQPAKWPINNNSVTVNAYLLIKNTIKILKKISPKDAPDLESAMVIARNMAKRHGKVAVERIQKEHKIMRTIEF